MILLDWSYKLKFLLLTVLSAFSADEVSAEGSVKQVYHDYIVLGAGPAGVQMGYFLQKADRDYIILERTNVTGSFFETYPRHDRLISINKRHTGKANREFQLRHDWNSLLSDDYSLRFTHYSKEYFPDRREYLKYIKDFTNKLKLKVQYNTMVDGISKAADGTMTEDGKEIKFTMKDQRGTMYSCRLLIVATGFTLPNVPTFAGSEYVEGYESVSTNRDDFEGQSVLILGRGNAAFEVADRIYGATSLIHMIARSRIRLSWSTHYVGDVRGLNSDILDAYQLKSLDGMLEASIEELHVKKGPDNKLRIGVSNRTLAYESAVNHDNFALRVPYDRIIRCLGFRFDDSIFSPDTIKLSRCMGRKSKYPKIDYNYESKDIPGLFFAGTITHSLDFRKSAGGFIHGFRYTSRALHRLLEWRYHGKRWPSHEGAVTDLLPVLVKRINEASGIYQMYGILGDIIVLNKDKYEYFEEFPINLLADFSHHTGLEYQPTNIIVVTLAYGANFSKPDTVVLGGDTFRFGRATGEPSEAHRSNFLHPIFHYYKRLPTGEEMRDIRARSPSQPLPHPDRLHHTLEDFLTQWDTPLSHVLPLRRFLEYCTSRNLRQYFAENCLQMALTKSGQLPDSCAQYLTGKQGDLKRDCFYNTTMGLMEGGTCGQAARPSPLLSMATLKDITEDYSRKYLDVKLFSSCGDDVKLLLASGRASGIKNIASMSTYLQSFL